MQFKLFIASLCACSLAMADGAEKVDTTAANVPRILLFAFDSFAGRGINGSRTVAKFLEGTSIGKAKIVIEVLPVHWGEPEARVPRAIEKYRPILVLGLGEGKPGAIAFERTARNHAGNFDERKKAPPAKVLLGMGKPELRTRLHYETAWCDKSPVPVVVSDDAGDYLCNNLLYVALMQTVERTGFMHLPPQGAEANEAYAKRIAPIIRTVIEKNLKDAK